MRNRFRLASIGVLAGLGVLALATPAAAHVEVSADKTQAGATDVTLTFHGEAESDSAGIAGERVVLPAGIAPADVSLVKAPSGWKFTRTADGFTVAGKALAVGRDAEWKVKVAKLPDGETRLSFKTLETYGDGEISRWIEIQQEGKDEPENPAPLVTLKPGPSTAPTTSPPPSAPVATSAAATSAAVPAPTTVQADPVASTGDSSSTWWIWVVIAVVLVAGGGGFALLRRRRGQDGPA